MVNLHQMSIRIAKKEGGKKQVNLCQIKEVMKLCFQELSKLPGTDVLNVLRRYK